MFVALIVSALPLGLRGPGQIWRALVVGAQTPSLRPEWINFASTRPRSPHNGDGRAVAQHQQAVAGKQAG